MCVKTVRCADITIVASKPRAGGWNSPSPASWRHNPAGRTYTTILTESAL
jgi:hypothetical protein